MVTSHLLTDGDGVNENEEDLAGTDTRDADSLSEVLGAQRESLYTNIAAASSTNSLACPTQPTGAGAFYRLRISPP